MRAKFETGLKHRIVNLVTGTLQRSFIFRELMIVIQLIIALLLIILMGICAFCPNRGSLLIIATTGGVDVGMYERTMVI